MSDNPFHEPDDDRTVIRPAPGGRRAAPPQQAPSPFGGQPEQNPFGASASQSPFGNAPQQPAPSMMPAAAPLDSAIELPKVGSSALVSASQPLLQLMARLRNTVGTPDPGDLRERAVAAMRRFESCLLYTSPSPRDISGSRMPSSA